ncbi:MAG: pyridoxamine 5'-phosphate oxidase [Trueperaceae bacterium]
MRLADLRTQYREGVLELADLDPDPLRQFEAWLADAVAAGLLEPNAMGLATVEPDGAPSLRMVLLKGLEDGRFVFYTHLESRKALALRGEARCALTFWWDALERQVRVEGVAAPVDDATADAYFASRPRGSQLGAWASPQSRPLPDRGALTRALAEAEARFPEAVARPPFWGGFAVTAHALEFWQGRASRLHDRFRYARDADGWARTRLGP